MSHLRWEDWLTVGIVAFGFLCALSAFALVALKLLYDRERRRDRGNQANTAAARVVELDTGDGWTVGSRQLGVSRSMLDERRVRAELRPRTGTVVNLGGARVIPLRPEYDDGKGDAA